MSAPTLAETLAIIAEAEARFGVEGLSDHEMLIRDLAAEVERLGAILTAERTDRGTDYERGVRDGDAEMMREVVRLRAEIATAHEAGVRDGLAAACDAVSTCCEAAYDAVSKIDPAAVRTTPTPKPAETGDCRTDDGRCAHCDMLGHPSWECPFPQ